VDNSIATDMRPEGGAQTGYASLWRNRDYLLLWSGQAVSSFGSQISGLTFPLLVLALTGSPAQAGIIGALRALPFALLSLPAGALIDRWDRRRTMIYCDTGRALALGSVPLALVLGRLGLGQLALVSIIEGSLFLFFNLAESSCLPRVVSKAQMPNALAQNGLTDSLAQLVGPSLGGALYGLGRAVPFAIDALSYTFSLLSLLFIRTPLQEERATETGRLRDEMREGLVWLWGQGILRLVALATGGLIVFSVGYPLIMIVLGERIGATPFGLGLIFAGGGAGSIVGGLITPWLQRRCRFGPLLIGAAWVWALTWLFFLFAPNVPALVVANAASFIVVPVYMTTQYRYRLAATPDRLQGRTNAAFRLIVWGSQPLGIALAGLLLERLGPDPTIWLLFVPQLLIAIAITANAGLRRAGWAK
jgi:predicted MFS family arabinose efflux permease